MQYHSEKFCAYLIYNKFYAEMFSVSECIRLILCESRAYNDKWNLGCMQFKVYNLIVLPKNALASPKLSLKNIVFSILIYMYVRAVLCALVVK